MNTEIVEMTDEEIEEELRQLEIEDGDETVEHADTQYSDYPETVSLQEIAEKYGDVDEAGQPLEAAKAKWIEANLTDEDIESWHEGNCTDHTRQLMDAMQIDCIQVWGSNTGSEPLSVVLC